MPKDATVGARVDAELKENAGAVFNEMGLPMSLGIELFLRQVAEKGKLPFALGDEESTDSESQKRARFRARIHRLVFRCLAAFREQGRRREGLCGIRV